jgi:hypothetical protein
VRVESTVSSFVEQDAVLLDVGIVVALAAVVAFWPVFLAAGIVAGAVWAGRAAHTRRATRRRQLAGIAARADYDHAAIMRAGAWRGTFGRYQPAPGWRADSGFVADSHGHPTRRGTELSAIASV